MTVMSENHTILDRNQQKALAALLSCPTVTEAAKKSRLSEATLFRYLRADEFKATYRRARSEIVEHAISQMQRDCSIATKTLCEVCEDAGAPAGARMTAAKSILDGAIKAVEIQDLAERVEQWELEQKENSKSYE